MLKGFSGFLLVCSRHGELRCEPRMFASSYTELERLLFQLLPFWDPTTLQLSGISFIYPLAKKQSFSRNYIGSFLTGAWPRGKAERFKWEKNNNRDFPLTFHCTGVCLPSSSGQKDRVSLSWVVCNFYSHSYATGAAIRRGRDGQRVKKKN